MQTHLKWKETLCSTKSDIEVNINVEVEKAALFFLSQMINQNYNSIEKAKST